MDKATITAVMTYFGRKAKGVPKRMTEAGLAQRRAAARRPRKRRAQVSQTKLNKVSNQTLANTKKVNADSSAAGGQVIL